MLCGTRPGAFKSERTDGQPDQRILTLRSAVASFPSTAAVTNRKGQSYASPQVILPGKIVSGNLRVVFVGIQCSYIMGTKSIDLFKLVNP